MHNITSQLSRLLLQVQMCLNQAASEYSSRIPALTRLRRGVCVCGGGGGHSCERYVSKCFGGMWRGGAGRTGVTEKVVNG